MTNHVYTIYNTLSKRYGDVMSFPNDSYAVARLVENSNIKQHPTEFELVRVGSIDIETGRITPCDPIRVALPLEAAGSLSVDDLANSVNTNK